MIPIHETARDGFTVSTDPARLDMALVHRILSTESYWAQGRSFDQIARAFAHSLPFGLYAPDRSLVGWARVITDYTTFAYLARCLGAGEPSRPGPVEIPGRGDHGASGSAEFAPLYPVHPRCPRAL